MIIRDNIQSTFEYISKRKRQQKSLMRCHHNMERIAMIGLTVMFTVITMSSAISTLVKPNKRRVDDVDSDILTTIQSNEYIVGLMSDEIQLVIDKAQMAKEISIISMDIKSNLENVDDEFAFRSDINLPSDLQKYTWEISEEYNIRYTLLLALMYRESGFKIDAIHHNADGTIDSGLMQLNDTTRPFLSEYGIVDYMDPYQNIQGGAILLRHHLDNNNQNEQCALMAYQYGQTGAQTLFSRNIWSSNAIDKLYQIERRIISMDNNPISYIR